MHERRKTLPPTYKRCSDPVTREECESRRAGCVKVDDHDYQVKNHELLLTNFSKIIAELKQDHLEVRAAVNINSKMITETRVEMHELRQEITPIIDVLKSIDESVKVFGKIGKFIKWLGGIVAVVSAAVVTTSDWFFHLINGK